MGDQDTAAGSPRVGPGAGYPIVRAADGQLYYYAYTDHGQPYGWKVGSADHLRHHHAHHVRGRTGSAHAAHLHHAAHHPSHPAVAGPSHRRAMAAGPDHAVTALQASAQRSGTGAGALGNARRIVETAPVETQEESGWAGRLERFEDRHLRLVLGLQGGLDLAAGPATVATCITIALALAPETGGLSLLLAAGGLLYGITRGVMQTAAGAAEVAVAAGGNREQEESVKEGMERVKTLTSISGFLSLSVQHYRHGTLSKKDWAGAGFASDAETFLTGRGIDRAFEEASEAVRISSRVANLLKWGGRADEMDQTHSATKDSLSAADWAQRVVEQRNRDRKKAVSSATSPGTTK